jgi:peroxiredoxin family protein
MSDSKLSILLLGASLERLQMAAMVASVGAVSGTQIRVLVSMNALSLFLKTNMSGPAPEGDFGRAMAGKKIPPFKQLLQNAVELGDAKIHPCSMALDVLGTRPEELESFLAAPMGLTRFLMDSAGGQLLTF